MLPHRDICENRFTSVSYGFSWCYCAACFAVTSIIFTERTYTCSHRFAMWTTTHEEALESRVSSPQGRAIVQAVSHRLPTAAARFRALVRSCGGQSGTGTGFLRVLRFPLPILIPPTAPHTYGAGTIGQLMADVPSGLSLTPPQETTQKYSPQTAWC
jgi:hypothetical protein